MRSVPVIVLVMIALLGCAAKEPEIPPVPPPPEDLSVWTLPELVQPPSMPEIPTHQGDDKPTAAEKVYDFVRGWMYAIPVAIGAPVDIIFGHNEQIRNIIGGDRTPVEANQTKPCETAEGADGNGETLRHHLFLTVSAPQLTMGLIVTTTQRTYILTCKSVGKSPVRVVRWRYPAEPVAAKPAKESGLLPDPTQPKHWHTGYTLTSARTTAPDWLPRYVVDEGRKMYIVFPEITLFATAPMVRKIGPNGAALVNARTFLNVLIVDELAGRLELRVGIGGTEEVVTITRGALRTIACPGDEACPVWPHAAQVLAHRAPPVQPPRPEGAQP